MSITKSITIQIEKSLIPIIPKQKLDEFRNPYAITVIHNS